MWLTYYALSSRELFADVHRPVSYRTPNYSLDDNRMPNKNYEWNQTPSSPTNPPHNIHQQRDPPLFVLHQQRDMTYEDVEYGMASPGTKVVLGKAMPYLEEYLKAKDISVDTFEDTKDFGSVPTFTEDALAAGVTEPTMQGSKVTPGKASITKDGVVSTAIPPTTTSTTTTGFVLWWTTTTTTTTTSTTTSTTTLTTSIAVEQEQRFITTTTTTTTTSTTTSTTTTTTTSTTTTTTSTTTTTTTLPYEGVAFYKGAFDYDCGGDKLSFLYWQGTFSGVEGTVNDCMTWCFDNSFFINTVSRFTPASVQCRGFAYDWMTNQCWWYTGEWVDPEERSGFTCYLAPTTTSTTTTTTTVEEGLIFKTETTLSLPLEMDVTIMSTTQKTGVANGVAAGMHTSACGSVIPSVFPDLVTCMSGAPGKNGATASMAMAIDNKLVGGNQPVYPYTSSPSSEEESAGGNGTNSTRLLLATDSPAPLVELDATAKPSIDPLLADTYGFSGSSSRRYSISSGEDHDPPRRKLAAVTLLNLQR